MALQYHDSPFHVTYDEGAASKMALKMDLAIFITQCLKTLSLKQNEVADRLSVTQSRISDLAKGKIEKFTIDAMIDMLDKLGFRSSFTSSGADGSAAGIVISKAVSA
ncbi:hypothetical protein PS3A_00520 [Pseudomonas sp. 3A(2025)]